jgi:hypothetical protein
LIGFYARKNRPEAIVKLIDNLEFVSYPANIPRDQLKPYPAVYRRLTLPGVAWLEHENYWFAFAVSERRSPLQILAVINASASFRRQTRHLRSKHEAGQGREIETAGSGDREASVFDDIHAMLSLVSEAFDAAAQGAGAENDWLGIVTRGADKGQTVERRGHHAGSGGPALRRGRRC